MGGGPGDGGVVAHRQPLCVSRHHEAPELDLAVAPDVGVWCQPGLERLECGLEDVHPVAVRKVHLQRGASLRAQITGGGDARGGRGGRGVCTRAARCPSPSPTCSPRRTWTRRACPSCACTRPRGRSPVCGVGGRQRCARACGGTGTSWARVSAATDESTPPNMVTTTVCLSFRELKWCGKQRANHGLPFSVHVALKILCEDRDC